MTIYERHETREEWLAARGGHIGASEAAPILGCGFMSKMDLWRIKTGQAKAKDLSDNSAVAYGNRAEEPLRQLFMAKHPELTLTYRPYDFVYQSERPWLRATLDGELTDNEDGDRGLLEIKTATCMSKSDWEKWDGRIPDGYLCQVSHQFLASGFHFAYLQVELIGRTESVIREYLFLREDMEANMDYLLREEEKFWRDVQTGAIPAASIRI